MKILIATLQFNGFSGSELYVFELAKELIKLGNDVSVIAQVIGGKLTKKAEQENIKVYSFFAPPCYEYGTTPETSHLLFKKCEVDFDIIHVQQNGPSDFITKLYPEVKKISTIHSEVLDFEIPVIHESIKKYICIRPEIQKHIVEKYPIQKENTIIIPNPIDNIKFNREKIEDRNYILFAGSLNYLRQNVTFDLIERAKNENKELWIVGYSNGSPYINDILGLENVKYFEDTENIEEFVKNSSYTVSVLFGRTVIESFMCGKNCLIYDIDQYGNILGSQMHSPPESLELFFSENVTKQILSVYNEVLGKITNYPVCLNVSTHNLHLLKQNIENCLEFSKNIFLNVNNDFSDDSIQTIREFENKKMINGLYTIVNKILFFAEKNFENFIDLDVDEFIEYNKVKHLIDFYENNNCSSLSVEVIKHFKNLNYELISKDSEYKKIIFSTTKQGNDKSTDLFEIHDLKQTYLGNKTQTELEIHKNFYYYDDIKTIKIDNKVYNIEKKDRCFLKFKNLKNVIILCKNSENNGSNWRIFQPYDRYENNINYDIDTNLVFNPQKLFKYDMFIMTRPLVNINHFFKKIKNSGVKVIIDYDDTFPLEPYYISGFREMIKECHEIIWDGLDVLSTSTVALKKYFEQLTWNKVVCLPNIVKPNLYTTKIEKNDNKIYLGWYGSGGHITCLSKIKQDVFRILDEFENVYLIIATNNPDLENLMRHPKTIYKKYETNFLKFENELNSFDINLAPIDETPGFLCKSNIRVQLAAIKNIPSIVSNFGEYKIFAKLNDGALVAEDDEWYDKIKYLVTNKNERLELAKKAKETVQKFFDYKKHSNERDELIRKIIDNAKI